MYVCVPLHGIPNNLYNEFHVQVEDISTIYEPSLTFSNQVHIHKQARKFILHYLEAATLRNIFTYSCVAKHLPLQK